jgi:hypothetical protein
MVDAVKRATGLIVFGVLLAASLVVGVPTPAVGAESHYEFRPGVYRNGTWYLRNSLTTGYADTTFVYGNPRTDTPLMCDFFGQKSGQAVREQQTPTVFRNPGRWLYRTSNTSGTADGTFRFGDPGDIPFCADLDGNGDDEPILFRNGEWFWRDGPTTGPAQHQTRFGDPGDLPIVFSRFGGAAPGVVRPGPIWFPGSFFGPVTPEAFPYGNPGDIPIGGSLNVPDPVNPGVVRGSEWLVHYNALPGYADIDFVFGNPGDVPLTWRDYSFIFS